MVAIQLEWPEQTRMRAIEAGAERFLRKMAETPGAATVWCLAEVVWPGLRRDAIDSSWLADVQFALVPLKRIGQMEGKSGSLVLIGRFWARSQARPSNPIVVKTRRKTESGPGLGDEWGQALLAKPHTYDRKDSFAIPVHFDDEDPDYESLWSLCLPTVRESEGATVDYEEFPSVVDLRKLLGSAPYPALPETTCTQPDAAAALERTYALMRNLHRSSAAPGTSTLDCEERPLGAEYEWYLRGYSAKPGGVWGLEWVDVWRTPSEPCIGDKANPLWLVERLKEERVSMQVGLVHGDLHPGNVILREGDMPAIIDFGWSRDRAHVAADFALMECNLRFLTLRAQVPEADLDIFSSALVRKKLEGLQCDYLTTRWKLVHVVQDAARLVFRSDTDWDREYLAPLFLVAFGLLRFAPQLGNQRAATLLVERLANHLASALDLS